MMIFASYGWENMSDDQVWNEDLRLARQAPGLGFDVLWSVDAPTMMITDFCICAPKLEDAERLARQHMGKFVESNFYQYEFLGEHFAAVKGYDAYAQKAEIARKGGLEGAVEGFMKAAMWGTPDRILRELEARRGVIGDFELNVSFRFGGIPYEKAEASLRLFAKEVLPV
jgi:alkanesulfonate monooxygenase SsuD/methylene tetrahydromethanopterin reductase-like flavin-dependent oxidoreductase (luciferase family)